MNLKIYAGIGLLSLGIYSLASALAIPASGIDWTGSTLQVSWTPEPGITPPAFSCFGQSSSPASETLENIGFSDGVEQPSLEDCFQQAGQYEVTLNLTDNAGNTNTQVYNFTITASDPDPNASSLVPAAECDNQTLDTSVVANNIDTCNVTLRLIDQFGNPVTQINTAELYSTTSEYSDEANLETSFLEGLRIGGNPLPTSSPGINATINNGDGTLVFSALSPSIQEVGDYLAQLVARPIDFSVNTEAIDEEGIPTGSLQLTPSAQIAFRHLFELKPYSDEEFRLDSPDPQEFQVGVTSFDATNFEYPETGDVENRNPDIEHENVALNPYIISSATPWSRPVTITTSIRAEEGLDLEDDTGLALSTIARYNAGGLPVAYPAGGVGLEGLNGLEDPDGDEIGYNIEGILLRIVGVDIEGGVLGDITKMILQGGTEQVAEVTANDIRQNITENAFRLIRGADNTYTGPQTFDSSWFDTSDVAIVDVEGGLVKLSGSLPSGRKTLVVKNGNLFIEGDVTYGDVNNDSFGVILLNETQGEYPETGNIFVNPNVLQIAGTYYADGGFMSVDETVITPTLADVINAPDNSQLYTQLLLTGTLFTRNTIGGALIGGDVLNPTYSTPWEESLTGAEGREKAFHYDLHFVRRYTPQLANPDPLGDPIENRVRCAPAGGSEPEYNECDNNDNAFVIRIDRKVAELPPPGFTLETPLIR
ncbi:hypothetical protein K9M59_03630 [Candidatus Gracilibacteria bacterium]|nr:hypothetical protein [Candidatus Gracilibacteria bacterium]